MSTRWVDERLTCGVLHLDVAACGRVSQAVLDAEVAHLRLEAELGGYVAQAQAEPLVQTGRAALARMVGLSAEDLCFVDGAGTAFVTLLEAWPLPSGARIGYTAGEYGANSRTLRRLADQRGWQLELLRVDGQGRVGEVPASLDLVTFPHIASQRGVLQPVDEVLATGTPLLLDVAQSLGQVEVPAGCAAYVGTSRKWLCGPRGVGFAVASPEVQTGLIEPATLAAVSETGMRRWEAQEAHVAGRVGLSVAAQAWEPQLIGAALAATQELRQAVEGVAGWRVREPLAEPTAITTLVGNDPVATRAALLADGVLVSAVPASRADDLTGPVLRLSTAAWVGSDDIDAVAAALHLHTK